MDNYEKQMKQKFNAIFGDALRATEEAEGIEQQDGQDIDDGDLYDEPQGQSDTDPDDFCQWSDLQGLQRPHASESDDFVAIADVIQALGFRSVDDLPSDHPLAMCDDSDFLTSGLAEQAATYHNTIQPQQQGQSLYEKLSRGDDSLAVQQEFQNASPETKQRIAELAAERGGLPTDMSLMLKADLQQAEHDRMDVESQAARDTLNKELSDTAKNRRHLAGLAKEGDGDASDTAKNRRHLAGLAKEGDGDAISTIQKMAEGSAE